MKLTVVRHTSVDVPKGICYGSSDVPLAPTFRNEVEKIRNELEMESFDTVFSSPLSRCTKLTTCIVRGNHFRMDDRLTELNFGDWEMVDWNDLFASEDGNKWFADYVNTRCPNGESCADLIERVELFLNELQRNSYKRVLVFTHAGVIRAMMCLLQHKTPQEAFQIPLEYGQITTFNFKK